MGAFSRSAEPPLLDKAKEFYERGCNLDHALACNDLGFLVSASDADLASSLYKKACKLGEPLGCENAGTPSPTAP